MAMKSSVGLSQHADYLAALKEACTQAKAKCDKPAIVLVFPTFNYDAKQFAQTSKIAQEVWGHKVEVAGGNTAGISVAGRRFDCMAANDRALGVVAIGGDGFKVVASLAADPGQKPADAGRALVAEAKAKHGEMPATGMIFTPSAGPDMSQAPMLVAMHEAAPKLRLSGTGLMGGMTPNMTIVASSPFLNDRVEPNGVLMVTFSGKLVQSTAMENGLSPVSDTAPAKITEMQHGKMVMQVNGKPAAKELAAIMTHDKPKSRSAAEKGLSIVQMELSRTFASKDPKEDFYWSRIFFPIPGQGDVLLDITADQGGDVVLCQWDTKNLMGAVHKAGTEVSKELKTKTPELVFAFSCAGRGMTLGPDVAREEKELESVIQPNSFFGIEAAGEVGTFPGQPPRFTGSLYSVFGIANA